MFDSELVAAGDMRDTSTILPTHVSCGIESIAQQMSSPRALAPYFDGLVEHPYAGQ